MPRFSASISRALVPRSRLMLVMCAGGMDFKDHLAALVRSRSGQSPTRCDLLAQMQHDIHSLVGPLFEAVGKNR